MTRFLFTCQNMHWKEQKSKKHKEDALLHQAACDWRACPRRSQAVYKRKRLSQPEMRPEFSSVQEPPPSRRNRGTVEGKYYVNSIKGAELKEFSGSSSCVLPKNRRRSGCLYDCSRCLYAPAVVDHDKNYFEKHIYNFSSRLLSRLLYLFLLLTN